MKNIKSLLILFFVSVLSSGLLHSIEEKSHKNIHKLHKQSQQPPCFVVRHACKILLTGLAIAYWVPTFRMCNDYREGRNELKSLGRSLGVDKDFARICSDFDKRIITDLSLEIVKATCCCGLAILIGSYLDNKMHESVAEDDNSEVEL